MTLGDRMFEHSIVRITGQMWKSNVALTLVLPAAALVAWGVFDNVFALAVGMVLGIVGVTVALLGVRCPSCGSHWYWTALSTQPVGGWARWLFAQTACPQCGFTGSDDVT